jgi:hypothetical protein
VFWVEFQRYCGGEKDHTLFEDRESELRQMDNKVTGED